MKIISVVGARPNFMKIAPFIRAIEKINRINTAENIQHVLVHTGQHYDHNMSGAFFSELEIPQANINLGVGSGSHAEQVGKTMIEFEKVLRFEKPDWVVVVGDVNATLACSITAKKENIKCCHIEAGLRSGDMTMPEEINRIVTDRICDLLLIPDEMSGQNLRLEGVSENKIQFVGNIMIDTLDSSIEKARALNLDEIISLNSTINKTGLKEGKKHFPSNYGVVTLHRPSNVDSIEVLLPIVNFLVKEVTEDMNIIWPVHPRTEAQLKKFSLWSDLVRHDNIYILNPVSYMEMLRLNLEAKIMITDSGGIQEECTVLGTPCLTLRWNTERPITLMENGGASILVGNNVDKIRKEYLHAISMPKIHSRPSLWDGKTAERCLEAITKFGSSK